MHFVNNISTDIKLSKAQIANIIQFGGFLRIVLGNLGKNVITDLAILLARYSLPSKVNSNAINKFEKYKWKTSCESKKKIYFIYFKRRYE